jgi:hypothetical protein
MQTLTLDQEFFLKSIELSVPQMSREQLEQEFISLSKLIIQKDNFYKAMLLEGAGIL